MTLSREEAVHSGDATRLQRTSLAEAAVDALLDLIASRRLKVDDSLPSTADLADQLGVSRTVVREAIAELAGQGLLSRRQGRETVVALPDARQLERLLRLRFTVQGADYEHLQEYREIIEVGTARLAAVHADDEDLRALQSRLDDLRSATDAEALHLADQAFHREVARIARNDMALLMIDGITPLLVQLRRHAWAGWTQSGKGLEPIVEAHATILDAIRRHEPEAAARAMQDHLTQAREGLLSEEAVESRPV